MNERGWTTNEADLLAIRFLDWVDSYQASGRIPGALSYYQRDEVTKDEKNVLIEVVRYLKDRGLIAGEMSLAGWGTFGAMLTSQGTRDVRDRQQRRKSRRARSVAARDAMLDWMYENASPASGETPEIDEFAGTLHAHFEGDPFTDSEITAAAEHLRDEEYITGVKVWGPPLVRPKVTSKGRRAVESNRYTAEPETGPSTVNSVTIGGDNFGQAAAGGHVTQEQTNGVDPARFAELVGDLRGALTDLHEGDRARAEAFVEMIEGEVSSDRPSTRVLDIARNGLQALGDKVANKAVGVGLDALWAYVASRLNLPAESNSPQ